MEAMLKELTVLDFTNNIAGPCAGVLLADQGANVIHVEKPVWGDDCRHFAPVIDGVGTTHIGVNHTKKSLVLDLKDPVAIELVRKAITKTDVVREQQAGGDGPPGPGL